MSQVKLTLRPPPNVDFVHGYPGIPPGAPDRPQAAVKGALEVRCGPQGVKAQWVRIELRKVETLPGGGLANTFYDYVGPSPINLWQSSDDYGVLQTSDFPFYIRIPESIPPSIALEKNAGIRYELVATVNVKTKKGFLRRSKALPIATTAPIIIDKHELHSTWPLYQQPEGRRLSQDGVELTVERAHTCYGPGDKVSVMATLKSDSLHTVILRGFEFTLKETSVFRAGLNNNRKAAPQVKVAVIGEQKVPVNATLYGGSQHKAELSCLIPRDHTTTSLNTARHIDITYVINVKALMGTGTHLIMDLPVIVSNWPRAVSIEAIRRIGPCPNLSLIGSGQGPQTAPPDTRHQLSHVASQNSITESITSRGGAGTNAAQALTVRSTSQRPGTAGSVQYNTAPNGHTNGHGDSSADEFGYGGGGARSKSATAAERSRAPHGSHSAARPRHQRNNSAADGAGRAPRASRFVANPNPGEDADAGGGGGAGRSAERAPRRQASANPAPAVTPPAQTRWPTADEEKKRLYEQARAKVERVQGSVALTEAPPISQPPAQIDAGPVVPTIASPTARHRWPTAEEEKLRLFNEAQAIAQRTQAFGSYSPPPSMHHDPAAGSNLSSGSGSGSGAAPSAGAALYSQALASLGRGAEGSLPAPPASRSPGAGGAPVPQYPSAEEEKAALRRYHEAKLAVDRNQNTGFSPGDEGADPIAYESLYPAASTSAAADRPPPFEAPPSNNNNSVLTALQEKERLRRQYEAQDAGAAPPPAPTAAAPSPEPHALPPSYSPPASASGSSMPPLMTPGLSEKELLRRRFEALDAQARAGAPAPLPPPRRGTSSPDAGPPPPSPPASSAGHGPRSPPQPPSPPAGRARPLNAAEEKAQLQARYAAEGANGVRAPAPPPLMPRPPASYIQETQEVDARTSLSGPRPDELDAVGVADLDAGLVAEDDVDALGGAPFGPYSMGAAASSVFMNGQGATHVSPPPLPPKVPISL